MEIKHFTEDSITQIYRDDGETVTEIKWQNGPICEDNPVNGVQIEDVINACLARLNEFQETHPCIENEETIRSLQAAYEWQQVRTRNRVAKGVEGTHAPH